MTPTRLPYLIGILAVLAIVTARPASANVFYDSSFAPANWTTYDLSIPGTTGSSVSFATMPNGGLGSAPPYRRATTSVGTAVNGVAAIAWAAQIYNAGSFSGKILSIDFSMNFQGLSFTYPVGGSGQAFGPMLKQGNVLFRAVPAKSSATTTAVAGWQALPFSETGLLDTDFDKVTGPYSVDTSVHPNFNDPNAVTQCGFFVANSGLIPYTDVAGYDEWTCTVYPQPPPMGTLYICKIAGPGVAVGTPFSFSMGAQTIAIPAGQAPNGTCRYPGQILIGTAETVHEAIPPGYTVSSITAVPSNALNSANLATGTASVTVVGATTQLFYTNNLVPLGTLKICKVAGPGVAVGSSFAFTAGSTQLNVLAGPAPGGYCTVGPSLPQGTLVNLQETIPPGYSVANITPGLANQLTNVNLSAGSATVQLGTGVTEVTYTNNNYRTKTHGYLEICKSGGLPGELLSFTLSGASITTNIGPITVPSGACSSAIAAPSGSVVVTETPGPNSSIIGSSTNPTSRQVSWNSTSSTVTVVPGDISTQTIVMIRNRPVKASPPPQ